MTRYAGNNIRRAVALAAVILFGGACGSDGFTTDMNRETVDGVECIVVRNSTSDHVRALDCNWRDAANTEERP